MNKNTTGFEKISMKKQHRCRNRKYRSCQPCKLSDIKPGCRARIICLNGTGKLRHRLFALGLLPSTQVNVIKRAPFGDPVELRIAGEHSITLSQSETSDIYVEPLA